MGQIKHTHAELERQVSELETESAELTKALTGLTCGGSEFFIKKGKRYVADIPACVAWVERRDRNAHDRYLDEHRKASVVPEMKEALEEVLRWDAYPNASCRQRIEAALAKANGERPSQSPTARRE